MVFPLRWYVSGTYIQPASLMKIWLYIIKVIIGRDGTVTRCCGTNGCCGTKWYLCFGTQVLDLVINGNFIYEKGKNSFFLGIGIFS